MCLCVRFDTVLDLILWVTAEIFRSPFNFVLPNRFRRRFTTEVSIISKKQLINEQIKASEVRLIGQDGNQLGVMSIDQALRIAGDAGLDLVEISPDANPIVCKILDYGKYYFDKEKREKENRRKTPIVETKEIQLTCNIASNDLQTKLKHAISFLSDGKKVKVMIKFKGREIVRPDRGTDLMTQFIEGCGENCVVEKQPLLDGRNMITILAPPKKSATSKGSNNQSKGKEKNG